MSFFDKIKNALGFSEPKDKTEIYQKERYCPKSHSEENRERFEFPHHNEPNRHFNTFTDPLEIHKYFEQQMDDMLKNFGFFGDGFTHFFNFSEQEDFPQIEDIPLSPEEKFSPSGNLRDQFLKPGFEKSTGPEKKVDEDIDGKLDISDWGSVFKGQNSPNPYQGQTALKNYFFGQTVTSKTVTNSDGSIEIHRTVRDNQGNEETTITRKIGDKEYSLTKRKDKDGKEETIENLVNLDEKEIDKFFPTQRTITSESDSKPFWPYFDRFFK